jgi:probable rRNA maturation factor
MEEPEQTSSIDVAGLPGRFEYLGPLIEKAATWIFGEHNVKSFAVSISFINDDEITRINEESLGRSGPTDVIAFDLSENGLPFEAVGDIYISVDTAIDNSTRFKVPAGEEILRLAVHGLLHIIGYDDGRVSAREKMTDIQEGIVKRFSAGRLR